MHVYAIKYIKYTNLFNNYMQKKSLILIQKNYILI